MFLLWFYLPPSQALVPGLLVKTYGCQASQDGKSSVVPGSTARTLSPLPCPRGSRVQGHGSGPGADGWGPASGRWFDQGGQGRRAHEGKPSGHVRAHSVLGRKPKRQDMYPVGSGRRVRAVTLSVYPANVWGWAGRGAGLSLETRDLWWR